ncbi:MAG: fatty acid cis/trans isomerase, partial [Nitrosospira sp.]
LRSIHIGRMDDIFRTLILPAIEMRSPPHSAADSAQMGSFAGNAYEQLHSNPRFWQSADWFQAKYRHDNPIHAGVFDLNRYQNR